MSTPHGFGSNPDPQHGPPPPPPPPPWPPHGDVPPRAGQPWPPPPQYHPRQPEIEQRAIISLVLGICGLVVCGLLSIPAWIVANAALRECDALSIVGPARGYATAGRVLGIVGTVMIALGVCFGLGVLGLMMAGLLSSVPFHH